MTNTRVLMLGGAVALMLTAATSYKVLTRYPVPGNGGFDYVTLDAATRRLFLSHASQVDVMDADTCKVAGTIPDTPGVHGIAIATPAKHGFTSNGAEHKVSMFDLATLQTIRKIDVGKGPDGIYYEPVTKRVFTNNHGSHDVSAIDSASGEVVGTVKLEGDGEQAVFGSDGMIYVNSENTNDVVVFDPKTLQVIRRMPIGVAKTPTGLAYDAKNARLFVACRNEPKMVVMDATSGKVIADFPIGTGADWAEFDADARLAFVSTGEGVLNIFHQTSADVYEDAGPVKTQPSAKTMALDRKTGKIFLPSVEYEFAPATEAGKQPRRTTKPGSFAVLVVAK